MHVQGGELRRHTFINDGLRRDRRARQGAPHGSPDAGRMRIQHDSSFQPENQVDTVPLAIVIAKYDF
jgi:hypothetical protein